MRKLGLFHELAERAKPAQEGDKPQAFLLFADVVKAGGSRRVRRNLFRSLFTGDGIDFSGGAIASYGLFDDKAALLASRVHRYTVPFHEAPVDGVGFDAFNSTCPRCTGH
jgi:hypothetical protein